MRDAFIEKAKKELNCEVVEVKVANGTEPVLTYKNHRVCWCAPRAKLLWTAQIRWVRGKAGMDRVC